MGMDFEVVSFPESLTPAHVIPFENLGLVSQSIDVFLAQEPTSQKIAKLAGKVFSHTTLPNTADIAYIKKLVSALRKKSPQLGSQSDALGLIARAIGYKNFASLRDKAPTKIQTQEEREKSLLACTAWTVNALGLTELLGAQGIVETLKQVASIPVWKANVPVGGEHSTSFQIYPNGTLVWAQPMQAVAYPLSQLGLVATEYELEELSLPSDAPDFESYEKLTQEQQLTLFHAAWIHAPAQKGTEYDLKEQHRLITENHDPSALIALKSREMERLYNSPYMLMSLAMDYTDALSTSPRFTSGKDSVLFCFNPADDNVVSQLLPQLFLKNIFACEVVHSRQALSQDFDELRMYLFSVSGMDEALDQVASISFKGKYYLHEELQALIDHVRPFLNYEGYSKLSDQTVLKYLLSSAKQAKDLAQARLLGSHAKL